MKSKVEIYPMKDTLVQKSDKEKLTNHKGMVFWMFGLSGSGKSTLARALERKLYNDGVFCKVLDGDNIRSGISNNLDFGIEGRDENNRRVAEVSKLFIENGTVVICSLISPMIEIRENAKDIIGSENFREVYINTSFEECARRDTKGLYKKALSGEIQYFTGYTAPFQEPTDPFLVIDTENETIDDCLELLYDQVKKEIKL